MTQNKFSYPQRSGFEDESKSQATQIIPRLNATRTLLQEASVKGATWNGVQNVLSRGGIAEQSSNSRSKCHQTTYIFLIFPGS